MAGKESMVRQRAGAMRDLMKYLTALGTRQTDLGGNPNDHIGDLDQEIKSLRDNTAGLESLKRFAENEYIEEDVQLALSQSYNLLPAELAAKEGLQGYAKASDLQKGTLDVVINRTGAHYDFLLSELLRAINANPEKFRCAEGHLARTLAEFFLDNDMQVLVNRKVIVPNVNVTFEKDKLTDEEIAALKEFGFSEDLLRAARESGASIKQDLNALDVLKLSLRDSVHGMCLATEKKDKEPGA